MFTNSLLTDIVGILVALTVITIVYVKWVFTYWSRRGVATVPPTFPLGNATGLLTKTEGFGEIWQTLYNKFKQQGLPYGGGYFIIQKFFIPVDPELVKSIMQKDFQHFVNHGNYVNEEVDPLTGHLFALEDAKWRNLRIKLTPTFTSGKMKMMFETLANCTSGLKENVEKSISTSDGADIKEILACFSTDIIGSCAFGIDCNSQKDPNSEFRKQGKLALSTEPRDLVRNFIPFAFPKNLLKKINYKIVRPETTEFFTNMVNKTVNYREKNNIYRKDFMHLLIQLKNMGKVTDDGKLTDGEVKETSLNMDEVAAQAFVFFLAGFETSSTTMTFALYELALNLEIQQKVREEVNSVLKKHDGKLTYDAIMEMHYMERVINETLRKYPPVPVLTRECNLDYKVPGSDLVIEKGTMVAISALGIHYDHEYYPNPMVFDPDRFTEENKSSRPSYTWLPFGEGPRICIGLRFGVMQAKVGLSTLLRNYEITINKKTAVPLIFDKNSFILSTEGGIYLNFKKI